MLFGEVINGKMKLSDIGKIAVNELLQTEKMRPNVKLDEWVIMPNHIHVIIIIENHASNCRDAMHCVSTDAASASGHAVSPYKNKFGPQKNNLSSIIRGFKMAVKTRCEKNNIDFLWQERFYDHIYPVK